jgi:hypothetical protein
MSEPEFADERRLPEEPDESSLAITVHHHGEPHDFTLSPESTLQDLSSAITETLSVPPENQKIMISPKPGMQKPPFTETPLTTLLPLQSTKKMKITLYGNTSTEITSLNESISTAQDRQRRRDQARSLALSKKSTSTRKPGSSQTSNPYTFHTLRPLPNLPNPSRSLTFLTRLRDDPGILSTMKTHKFSVPLLTEMDPATHTTENSRTLGLNRNKGEVIELRLRTDAYDGYRDYRTIRKTLCHELAHCVFGEHDRDFWDLMARIEKEVERGDYWGGKGRSVAGAGGSAGGDEFYNPEDWRVNADQVVADHGGWSGGEFVLGGSGSGSGGTETGLSRREVLARAAEERMREKGREGEGGGEKS